MARQDFMNGATGHTQIIHKDLACIASSNCYSVSIGAKSYRLKWKFCLDTLHHDLFITVIENDFSIHTYRAQEKSIERTESHSTNTRLVRLFEGICLLLVFSVKKHNLTIIVCCCKSVLRKWGEHNLVDWTRHTLGF